MLIKGYENTLGRFIMNIQINREYLLDCFRRVVETPSPVGYYTKLNPVLEALAAELGDRKSVV